MNTGTVTVVGFKSTGSLFWVPEKDGQSESSGGLLASTQSKLPLFFPFGVFAEIQNKLAPFSEFQICPIMTKEPKEEAWEKSCKSQWVDIY